ncbi:hypothetical protein GGX14DRAFT_567934 [Mycena pura]|uniref:Uncharacterized protein n=1 Tax=Mycena pura TaxID=153505 RepID=A0AAD6Y8A5_9AGAR|nr:hypothetical protein GGX14DRAFT_567934 [Mycena pura]
MPRETPVVVAAVSVAFPDSGGYCGSHVPLTLDSEPQAFEITSQASGPVPQESHGTDMGITDGTENIIDNPRLCDSPLSLCSIPRIFTTAPELFNRYSRAETIKTPVGWIAHVHPEGALYYVHDEKRIFTDAHLHIDAVSDTVAAFIDKIEGRYADNGTSPYAHGVDLVLDLVKSENGEMLCGYYFVDHRERIVFWDDEFELDRLEHAQEVQGVTSAQHITISVTPMLIAELRDVLIHHIGDAMTSPTSTVTSSVEDLLKMLTVVESMEENAKSDLSGSACILGRFMWTFTSQMFYHFYGEPCARLDKTQSVYGHVSQHSLLIKTVAPVLLYAPLTHMRMFEEVYADEIVSHVQWRRVIELLDQEWQQLTLFATVLLNSDIAFLAIPTVDNGNHAPKSVAQIAAYMSVVASLGSVVVGLFLSRLNRKRRDAEDYVDQAVSVDQLLHDHCA